MSNVSQSPSPNKPNPRWNDQVKIGRGRTDTGAFHRAIAVASKLFEDGVWDGRGLLVVHDAYDTHLKMEFYREPLAEGADYEFAEDSLYRREQPAEANTDSQAIEIDGQAYQVRGRMTVEELERVSPRAAEFWRRDGVVARCEVRRPRGRTSYITKQYSDGRFSRPWRGSLIAAN